MTISIRIKVYANGDDAFIAWVPSEFIPQCRGFMLERRRKTGMDEITEIVENRVGFKKDKPKSGEHRPSTEWPFQRFNWSDYEVNAGDTVRYKVTAMIDGGTGRPYQKGPKSKWTPWIELTASVTDGFSCYFNRGLVLSQFVARYMKDKGLSPAKLKAELKGNVNPAFRNFLEGDLGARIRKMLNEAKNGANKVNAALYELDDKILEDAMIATGANLNLILANGSDKTGDGNKQSRKHLNDNGIPTIDRMLGSKGLGHNKFVVLTDQNGPHAVWTGSTNWATTGLCTQINNGVHIENAAIANLYNQQWELLKRASPPITDPAKFTNELIQANDQSHTFSIGTTQVTIWFTRTSDGRDMQALRELISHAKHAILFLMFTPGAAGLHKAAGKRAGEKGMYVRGVVSNLGTTSEDNAKNVLDVKLVSNDQAFKPDRYSVLQPQGVEADLGAWIGEVTRRNFLSEIGHAIVHSKVLVIDPLSKNPVVVTGSHNYSDPASKKNDENLVIIRGNKPLAMAYAAHIMSVYQHYRYRSYIREKLAEGKKPWSFLVDNDQWLKDELDTKALEYNFWG